MIGYGSGGDFTEPNTDVVADAMVDIESARANADRLHADICSCGSGNISQDWADILAWTPMANSAQFASANGL